MGLAERSFSIVLFCLLDLRKASVASLSRVPWHANGPSLFTHHDMTPSSSGRFSPLLCTCMTYVMTKAWSPPWSEPRTPAVTARGAHN